jgi:hypothetical protein
MLTMTRRGRAIVRAGSVILIGLGIGACEEATDAPVETASSFDCIEADGPTPQTAEAPINLVVCPLEPHTGEPTVFVGLVNRSHGALVANARFDPQGDLDLILKTSSGEMLAVQGGWEPGAIQPEAESYFQWVLPVGGVMGRKINLGCDFEPLGDGTTRGECVPLYEMPPGEYTLVAEVRGLKLCDSLPCALSEVPGQTLSAGPVTIEVRR